MTISLYILIPLVFLALVGALAIGGLVTFIYMALPGVGRL